MKWKWLFGLTIMLMLGSFSNALHAQYIVHEQDYDGELSYDALPDNITNPEDEALFFLNLPEDQLKSAMQATGSDIQVTPTTIYLDGNNLAVESESPEGKTTMVSNSKEATFYLINWPQKQVLVMSADDIAEMKAESEKAREQAMQNLAPEVRKQIEEAEKADDANRAAAAAPNAEPTGKKMQKYGFDCTQYLIKKEDETVSVWASKAHPDLANTVRALSKEWSEAFSMGEEEEDQEADEWELLPGQIPVEVRAYQGGTMGTPSMNVTVITSIERRQPPADVFRVPGQSDGFTHQSMKDLMQQMMQMMPQDQGQ